MTTARIRSARLLLDEVRTTDVDAVLEYCQDDELQRWVPLPSPYLRSDAEYFTGSYAAEAAHSGKFSLWAIRLIDPDSPLAQPLVGAIELRFEPLRSATVGFWLGSRHRGLGLMTEALGALVDHAFDENGDGLGLQRLHWQSVAGNTGSATVARRTGFRFEGVSRRALVHRDTRVDSWEATLLHDDARTEPDGWPL